MKNTFDLRRRRAGDAALGLIIFALASTLFSILSLTGCTRGTKSNQQTLVIALSTNPNTLDPRFATDASGMRLANLLFSSLVRVGPDLRVIGEAAAKWMYEDNTYTFDLRPGLTFADGRAVTADDIEFSLRQFMNPRSPFSSALKPITSVEVKYDQEARYVKLRLAAFSAPLLSDLSAVKILPKAAVLEHGDDFGRLPVGSGPYKFISRNANEIRLQARDSHPYAQAKTKDLVFKIIRDDNTRFLKTLKGEIDVIQSEIPLNRIKDLEKKNEFEIYKYPGLTMTYLLINLRDPLFKKLQARQALAHAIDRGEIINFKLDGLASPATSILSPSNPYFNKSLSAPIFDREAAGKLLALTGLSGREISLKTSNTLAAIENGKVLANQLDLAGLKIKHQSFEWGTFYGDIQKGNFQLATLKWVGANDPDIYRTALHSKETPDNAGRNRGGYSNPRLDKILEEGLKIADQDARIRHYQEAQKIVLEDLPFIPLWYDSEVAVVHKRVKGFTPSRNGDYSGLIQAYKLDR